MSDLIDGIRAEIEKAKLNSFQGKIVSKSGRTVRVKPRGSNNTVPCLYEPSLLPNIGDECFVEWIVGRTKGYVVTAIYSRRATGTNNAANGEVLTPPLNLNISNLIPNAALLRWDAVIPSPLAYEVQYNSVESESGASNDIITRGSFAIIESESPVYARVRSVNSAFEYSSWTAWVSVVPAPNVGAYTPTIPSNWEGAPEDSQEAIDELADRLSRLDDAFFYAAKQFHYTNVTAVTGQPEIVIDIDSNQYTRIEIDALLKADTPATDFDYLGIVFNEDTDAAHYLSARHIFGYATGGAVENTNAMATQIPASSAPSGAFGSVKIELAYYAEENAYKVVFIKAGDIRDISTLAFQHQSAITWQSLDPITKITLYVPSGNNFVQYSKLRAYGLKAL